MAKKKEASKAQSKFELALEKLNKSYGKGTVLTLDAKPHGEHDVISSGSIGFDYITLGVGGFVKGKLYELMGWEGTGKSTICGHAAAECQKAGGVVLYIDGEHAVDKKYFKQLGVDTTKMLIAQPSCGEEGFSIALEMIATEEVDLIIIDSDSSLIPKAVLDGEVGDSAIGKKAKLNSNSYPKIKSALAKSNVCVIVISQYREKIGVMFGNPTTTQGGHALKFYSDCRIEVSRSLAKEGDVTYGNVTKVRATKNKMSPPYRNTNFEIVYGVGIDRAGEVVNLISDLGIGKKWGSTLTINEVKHNIEDFKQSLLEEPDFYDQMKSLIINRLENPDEETEL